MAGDYDVVIVGAGAAGIGAARQLAGTGLSTLLLEASGRVGGRAWTQRLDGLALDMGCGWLHSGERNVWTRIAAEEGFAVDRSPSAWDRQYRDLGFSADEQAAAGGAYDAWMARLEKEPPASDCAADALRPGGPWNAYIEALSGYLNGAALSRVSVADYLAYDRAASERNWRVREGYGTLIGASLPAATAIRLATPVEAIDDSGTMLRLETRAGAIKARAVIVTVPTSVLASGAIRMSPALDDRLDAAACLPLGHDEKLFLALEGDHPFEAETHVIGDPRRAGTGSYYIMPLGRPLIEGFYGGAGAVAVARLGAAGAFALAIDELAALFGNGVRRHLRPLAVSAWSRTDGIGGAYSHALPGHAGQRAVLAAPMNGRLFFAGEATHATDFSTAHGAHDSGVRAAEEAIASLASFARSLHPA